MRTPAGKECKYFYGDYYRGRQQEECRLLSFASPALQWRRDYCATCPVPAILLANACPNMMLEPSLGRSLPLLKKTVQVRTFCNKTGAHNFDPHIGCGECHSLPPEFTGDII